MKKYLYSVGYVFVAAFIITLFQKNDFDDKQDKKFDCSSLEKEEVVYKVANHFLNDAFVPTGHIWNLHSIDTVSGLLLNLEDYFINQREKHRLVLIDGEAGFSSGNADNLLLLFSCKDTLSVLWTEQIGDFTLSDIKDLNGDGVKEIVADYFSIWMGECSGAKEIFNFKDMKKNVLYISRSHSSHPKCGGGFVENRFSEGDTVSNNFDISLKKMQGGKFMIQQVQNIEICGGGKTEKEFIEKLKISIDTTFIEIK